MKTDYTDKELKAIEDGGFVDSDGKWNSIVVDTETGELCRKRVETLIVKNKTKVFLWLTSSGRYKIPGGTIEREVPDEEQAAIECKEEAKITVKNVIDTGIEYTDICYFPDSAKINHLGLKWNGTISRVYVASFHKSYLGKIEQTAMDYKMSKYGRFYDINDIFEILRPEHQKALIDILHIEPICEKNNILKCKLFK